MTEQEINEGNKKIEQHNKFCFMKKQLPKYKEIVPLSQVIVLFMVSGALLALPTLVSVDRSDCIPFGKNNVMIVK